MEMRPPSMEKDLSISAPTTPTVKPEISSPLFIEINIPLPALPVLPPSNPRHRTLSLSSLSFHRHASSSPHLSHHSQQCYHFRGHHTKSSDAKHVDPLLGTAIGKTVARRRTQTLGALAVAPAVLMLSTEIFTPS